MRRNSLLLRRSIFVLSLRHHPRLRPFLLVSYRTRLFTKQSVPIPHSTCRCVFYECTHHSFLFFSLCRSFVERPFAICFASNSHPAVDLPCSLAASPFRAFLYSLLLVSCFISVVSFLVDNGICPPPAPRSPLSFCEASFIYSLPLTLLLANLFCLPPSSFGIIPACYYCYDYFLLLLRPCASQKPIVVSSVDFCSGASIPLLFSIVFRWLCLCIPPCELSLNCLAVILSLGAPFNSPPSASRLR